MPVPDFRPGVHLPQEILEDPREDKHIVRELQGKNVGNEPEYHHPEFRGERVIREGPYAPEKKKDPIFHGESALQPCHQCDGILPLLPVAGENSRLYR